MKSNPPISVCFRTGSYFVDESEHADGPVIEFMLSASSADRPPELITIPISEIEFERCRRHAAIEGQTIEQWLVAGLSKAIASPESLRSVQGA